MLLSLVVPCFNEENNVRPFFNAAATSLKRFEGHYEIIFVNDGSSDNTYKELTAIYNENQDFVSVVNFSRNFGKEAAILAGLKATKGDYVSIIDADLQQDPDYILQMFDILQNNPEYDSVAAYQDIRNERKMLALFKDIFYKLINMFTELDMFHSASDFRLLKRVVVDAIIDLPEKCRFSKGIFSWVGFNTYYMPYTVKERNSGVSKWSFFKLTRYAIDGIISFSNTPLLFSIFASALSGIISLILFIVAGVRHWVFSYNTSLTVIIAVIFLVSALNLLAIGILSKYLSKTYTEIKNRPVYIVKNTLKKEENK